MGFVLLSELNQTHERGRRTISAALATGIKEDENQELEKIENKIDIEEQKLFYIVHKVPIIGAINIYICPHCKLFYCGKCAAVLKEKREKCWSYEKDINL